MFFVVCNSILCYLYYSACTIKGLTVGAIPACMGNTFAWLAGMLIEPSQRAWEILINKGKYLSKQHFPFTLCGG